ncbi:hypothetical protein ALON55S_05510 [Alishewanella longhuensis]
MKHSAMLKDTLARSLHKHKLRTFLTLISQAVNI